MASVKESIESQDAHNLAKLVATQARLTAPVTTVGVKSYLVAEPETLAPIKTTPVAQTTAMAEMVQHANFQPVETQNNPEPMTAPTKSGDTWLNITLPSTTVPTPTVPGQMTPEQKNQRAIIIAAVLLVVMVMLIWLLNRKK